MAATGHTRLLTPKCKPQALGHTHHISLPGGHTCLVASGHFHVPENSVGCCSLQSRGFVLENLRQCSPPALVPLLPATHATLTLWALCHPASAVPPWAWGRGLFAGTPGK